MKWHLPIPPRVAEAMDEAQKWAISCTRAALEDYGRAEEVQRSRTLRGARIGYRHTTRSLAVPVDAAGNELGIHVKKVLGTGLRADTRSVSVVAQVAVR